MNLLPGETLDDHLRGRPNGYVTEKEARGVVIQLFCGLKAMNRREEPIIHYDLKPSNLIYDRGVIKIIDFGLSKIIRDADHTKEQVNSQQNNILKEDLVTIDDTKLMIDPKIRDIGDTDNEYMPPERRMQKGIEEEMERDKLLNGKKKNPHHSDQINQINSEFAEQACDLTSIGCGTFWYLPSECFPKHVDADTNTINGVTKGKDGKNIKVSNKVDVWSVGVIHYEMLFGRRPFGHKQSQDGFYASTMKSASPLTVEFPDTPKISRECMEFIRRLLNPDPETRPSVFEACQDAYLTKGKI